MAYNASRIALAAVTGKTRGSVDFAVNSMLAYVVPWMRHAPVRLIFVFVARLDFFLMRVAVGAEGFCMAHFACLMLLRSVEFMPVDIFRAVVHRRSPIIMAITADGIF